MARGVDYLLYVLLDTLVDRYFPALDAFDEAIDGLEDAIIADPTPAVLNTIFAMKRNVVQLRKVINPQLESFSRLTSESYGVVQADNLIYYRDVHDHLIRIFEVVDSYRDQMSSALDAYLSMTSNRMNEVMKRLTVVAAIFLPITFLTGVFGMNFGSAAVGAAGPRLALLGQRRGDDRHYGRADHVLSPQAVDLAVA